MSEPFLVPHVLFLVFTSLSESCQSKYSGHVTSNARAFPGSSSLAIFNPVLAAYLELHLGRLSRRCRGMCEHVEVPQTCTPPLPPLPHTAPPSHACLHALQARLYNPQFTCFTGTKVQILTLARLADAGVPVESPGTTTLEAIQMLRCISPTVAAFVSLLGT